MNMPDTIRQPETAGQQDGIVRRLSNHIAIMGPHQRERRGGQLLIEARDALKALDEGFAIFDILPRLWATGHKTVEQDGKWHLFRNDGEGLMVGATFRDLCVNIVLAGY